MTVFLAACAWSMAWILLGLLSYMACLKFCKANPNIGMLGGHYDDLKDSRVIFISFMIIWPVLINLHLLQILIYFTFFKMQDLVNKFLED